jgi:hypothetical protein
MTEHSPVSVGLGGDGDEIAAIADVEDAFGVKLDHSDASGWLTAGDVFDSLRRALPSGERDATDLWERFTTALSAETDVDPRNIERGSPLLSESRFWARLATASAVVWIVVVLSFVAVVAGTALVAR